MDDLLELLTHQGFITTRDATRLGVSCTALAAAVRAGRLRRGLRGVFLPPSALTTEQEISALTRAVLSTDPFAVASHQSAVALLGLPCHKVPLAPIHIADLRKSTRIHESIHRHVLRPLDPVVELEGCRALAGDLACLQVAARYGVASGLVAMDAALHRGLATHDGMLDLLDRGRVRRGLVAARTAVATADPRAESPGESLLRLALVGLPWPVDLQVGLGDAAHPYRVDLLVDGRVVVEFDGEVKYDGPGGHHALIAEKAREDWLRDRGYDFVRVKWSQLAYPAALRHVVHQTVLRARAHRVA